MDRRRIRHIRSFGDVPENSIQFILWNAIVLAPVHLLRLQCVRRLRSVSCKQIHLWFDRVVGSDFGGFAEAVEHRGRTGIGLRHRRQTQDKLHRPNHARSRVERAVHDPALTVRTDHETNRAMSIHVVGPVLRVVLDDEDCHLLPEPAARGGLDNFAETNVIAGDARVRRERTGSGAAGVILAQRHDGKPRQLSDLLRSV